MAAAGELIALVIDPHKRTITHYVVRMKKDGVERMAPAELVSASTPEKLQLTCTLAELNAQQSFVKDEIVGQQVIDPRDAAFSAAYGYGYGYGIPDVVPAGIQYAHVQSDRVPQGELEMRSGTPVRATDGQVGTVSTLVTDKEGVITHFVVDHGRPGGRSQLTLPLSAIDYTDDEGVHLKLDKAAVASLPSMPTPGGGPLGPGWQRMELLAKVFDDPSGARKALDYVHNLEQQAGRPIHIRESAILVRDAEGKPRIEQSSQPSVKKGAVVGAAAGGLLTLLGPLGFAAGAAIGGGLGAAAGPKMDMGFPDAFLKRLESKLQPGHSALVLLSEHDFAQNLAETLATYDNVVGGQKLVDTLVQELLLENPAAGEQPR
ncbi:MAG TPA: DUF1269 domain-containing protein [Chloroflexota bacterium]|nr:DUF1269 domain-containing protein [Chloroflexota bacterium]